MRYFILISLIGITLFGCAKEPKPSSKFDNIEAPENLQRFAPFKCVSLTEVTNMQTPADLYPAVGECVKAGNYESAGQLFALAGAYGRFDMLRVSDQTALQAIPVLQQQIFSSINDKQKKEFQTKALNAYSKTDSTEFSNMCAQVKKIGPPAYFPVYMIQHGMGTFQGNSDDGLKPDFDEAQAWQESLTKYLHCP